MTASVSRELVQNYFLACISRDPARISLFLDDDVEWTISGPVDLLPFCGTRRGKAAVLDTIVRIVPSVLQVTEMAIQELLIDGDRASTFMQLSATRHGGGGSVSYRAAQFMHFRNGKLFQFRGLIDSFDAAEQLLGRAIELPNAGQPANVIGNLIVADAAEAVF